MALVLDGGGTISGLNAGGLPDASIIQSDLASGIAGNGPTFYAYRSSSAQALSAGTQTVIQFEAEKWDLGGCYNNTGSTASLNGISCPAWSFAPNVAGYYLLAATVRYDVVGNIVTHTYINHSVDGTVGTGSFVSSTQNQAASHASTIAYFNGTSHSAQVATYVASAGNTLTGIGVVYFTASLLRAA